MMATFREPSGGEAPEIPGNPVAIPITGDLDLHTFRPGDLRELLPAYLTECRERKIFSVRIVHGKGTGALRASVQGLLRKSPQVLSFATAAENNGGWGATVAYLRR